MSGPVFRLVPPPGNKTQLDPLDLVRSRFRFFWVVVDDDDGDADDDDFVVVGVVGVVVGVGVVVVFFLFLIFFCFLVEFFTCLSNLTRLQLLILHFAPISLGDWQEWILTS